MRPACPRYPQAELGSCEQEVGIPWMLAHDVHASGRIRNPVADGFPVLTVVVGGKNIDVIIVSTMPIERQQRHAVTSLGSHYAAHISSLRYSGHLGSDIFPGPPAIAGHLHIAVIGAHPKNIWRQQRFAERCDGGIFLNSVVPR